MAKVLQAPQGDALTMETAEPAVATRHTVLMKAIRSIEVAKASTVHPFEWDAQPRCRTELEPRAQPCDELYIAGVPAGLAHVICRPPEVARPNDPDVRRKLPPYLVTKAQADLKIGQT
jgi:hypothetical protein